MAELAENEMKANCAMPERVGSNEGLGSTAHWWRETGIGEQQDAINLPVMRTEDCAATVLTFSAAHTGV